MSNDMLYIRSALLTDAGVAALPTFLCAGDVAAGRLVRVLPRWSAQSSSLWLVRPGGRDAPPKVAAFVDLVLEELRARGLLSR